jgi:RimJ/RimL family protein N-acetyltransferase
MDRIKGICTQLVEVSVKYVSEIVALRNDSNFNKYLFQSELTFDNQVKWIENNKRKGDNINFVILDKNDSFKGTISIYDIQNNRGEFGRFIATNSINAVEAEYLLLKFSFDNLMLDRIFCQTNIENTSVWQMHTKLGFQSIKNIEIFVGDNHLTKVEAVVQEISKDQFQKFDYQPIFSLINKINAIT